MKIFKRWHLHYIPIILITIFLVKFIFNFENLIFPFGTKILSILSPFFWALGLAYLLNPLIDFFENRLKMKRYLSLIISYLIIIGFISLSIVVVFPTILGSLSDLFKNLPLYAENTEGWINEKIYLFNQTYDINPFVLQHIEKSSASLLNSVNIFINDFISSFLSSTIKFTTSFMKFIFGFIISIYILKDKEKLIQISKKLLSFVIPKEKHQDIFSFLTEANSVFSDFIIGKSIDSLIIGLLCYIGLLIIHSPFALLISLLVGVTNMIPYFGPIIGMIPAVILTILVNPDKTIIVLIFIFLLQQFDGFYLGPKILSEKVGLSPLLVILALTIGGGFFGVLGMFVSVPIMALIKTYTKHLIHSKPSHKDLNDIDS